MRRIFIGLKTYESMQWTHAVLHGKVYKNECNMYIYMALIKHGAGFDWNLSMFLASRQEA